MYVLYPGGFLYENTKIGFWESQNCDTAMQCPEEHQRIAS